MGSTITFPRIAYNKKKAEVGKLEKIFIKDLKVNTDQRYLYVDINNSYWNQDDLIELTEAESLIRDYYATILPVGAFSIAFDASFDTMNINEGLPIPIPSIITGPQINFPSIAYNRRKAQTGKLEKILIKDLKVNSTNQYLYVDINNSYWNTTDLISLEEAQDLMRTYYEGKL